MVKLFLDIGAEFDKSLLIFAAKNDNLDMVKLFLDMGAEVNVPEEVTGLMTVCMDLFARRNSVFFFFFSTSYN
jgi:ankyrin repeat protein